MSGVDLNPIVDAAYRAHRVAGRGRDMVPGEYEATYSRVEAAWMKHVIVEVAPLIEAAVREQVAQEIDRLQAGAESNDDRVTLRAAARIARGQS